MLHIWETKERQKLRPMGTRIPQSIFGTVGTVWESGTETAPSAHEAKGGK